MKRTASKEDAALIEAIADRCIATGCDGLDRKTILRELTLCHLNACPLRLEAMMNGDLFNLAHDVYGIHAHLNHKTGKLDNLFVPRYREDIDYLPPEMLTAIASRPPTEEGFIDAQEQHRLFPDTFEVPPKDALDALKPRDLVKVCHNYERFWVKIVKVDGDEVTGTVDNNLWRPQPFNYGDEIHFEKRHIYSLFSI